jgi:dipeptidyl-peptidase-4
MTRAPWIAFALALGIGCAPTLHPTEHSTMTALDRDSLDRLREISETGGYTQGLPQQIQVLPDGSAALFLRTGPRDLVTKLYAFDFATGKASELASAESLLGAGEEKLSPEEKARRERQRVISRGIADYVLSEDGALVLVPSSGSLFVLERAGGAAHKLEAVSGATDPRFSPDGRWVSFVRDHDLWICDWRKGELRPVTTGGTEEVSHGEAEFVAQEEMNRFTGYWWSPDSASVAWEESDTREVTKVYIADPSRPSKAPESFAYPFAGTPNAKVRLAVQAIAPGSKPVWVEWDREAFPYLASVVWEKEGPLSILVQTRNQRDERLYSVDAASGKLTELLREHDDAWLDLDQDFPHWLPSGRFLWKSQADGEWRLQLRDASGKLVSVLNPAPASGPEARIRGLAHVDEAKGIAVVTGATDAPQQHLYELSLAQPAPPKALTTGTGTFERFYAKKSGAYVELFTSLKSLAVTTAHRADGSAAGTLPSVAATPPFLPNVERTKAGGFDVEIIRPRGFLAGKRYPVIDFVYGGPSDGTVHESLFGTFLFRAQWYADHGFIVVTAENRGVYNRGRAWEKAILNDFAGPPLDDQIAALKATAAAHPELDLSRVGISGWSYGGFMSALAVCRRGDFFKAAVAGAPVTDWADYDTHYTERYVGTPKDNPDAYERSNVLTYAKTLDRPLLIFHGTADDNVYFVHSLKLADALFKAGKRFDLVPIIGQTHMAIRLPEFAVGIDGRSVEFFRDTLGP